MRTLTIAMILSSLLATDFGQEYRLRTQVDLVVVPVSVRDAHGKLVASTS